MCKPSNGFTLRSDRATLILQLNAYPRLRPKHSWFGGFFRALERPCGTVTSFSEHLCSLFWMSLLHIPANIFRKLLYGRLKGPHAFFLFICERLAYGIKENSRAAV